MSATNSTTNYGLPVFLSQDVPSWLTDWNSAMSDIDTAIAAAKTAADGAQLTASNAQAAATQNAGAISQLQTTVGTMSGNVTSLSGAVNTINSLIGNGTPTTTDQTLIGAINELHADQGDLDDLQTTDKSSLVAAINEAAQGGGGSTPTAADVSYSNTTSGLTANTVQAAIDELAAGGAGGFRLVATSEANQTNAVQLNSLYAAYQQLTLAEKLNSVLVRNDDVVFFLRSITNAEYSNCATQSSAIYNQSASLSDGGHFYTASGTTVSDASSTVNSGTIKLYVLA